MQPARRGCICFARGPRPLSGPRVSSRKFTLRELMAVIEEESGRTLNISWGARSYNQGEIMDPYTDGPPGWSPK